jgi:hypothetical protein
MSNSETIRLLNDKFRKTGAGGVITVTRGIAVREDAAEILEKIRVFDGFNEDNDPFGEHDFGAFEHGLRQVFWKIDYYDKDLHHGASDPTNPANTTRVLTIMLADEY